MTPADREGARAALLAGRATYARLDQIRGPEDAAADVVDLWGAAESAMRAMLGGSVLSGQALVREMRQRGLLGLDQANALASFWDARARVDSVSYKPTLTDVGYARAGYNELGRAIEQAGATAAAPAYSAGAVGVAGAMGAGAMGAGAAGAGAASAVGVPPVPAGPGGTAAPTASIEMPTYEQQRPAARRGFRGLSTAAVAGIAVAVAALIVIVVYATTRGSGYERAMAAGVDEMTGGRVEAARASFSSAARERPNEAEPHVFLSRLARTEGDVNTARSELETAIRNEPSSAQAQREMGLLLLAQGQPELARRFFVRAVQYDPKDLASQGYLGCSLVRLGREEEGRRFMSRAGSGAWSSCTAAPAAASQMGAAPVIR